MAFLATTPAPASDFRSPRSTALGGAGHASPLLNDSIYQNPSFASLLPVYSWSGNWRALGEGNGRTYSLSVLDGRSELFQAGAGFLLRDDLSALHLGASKKIRPYLAVGVGGKLFFLKNGASPKIKNINLSASANPLKWLRLSLLADNLLPSEGGHSLGLERELILGTKWILSEVIAIYIDPRTRLGKGLELPVNPVLGYEAGSEVALFRDFYLRLGSFHRVPHPDIRTKARGYGLGFGWVAPRLSLDFAFERILEPQARLSSNFGTTIYF